MIIAINKMDMQQYSEKRFGEVKEEVSKLLKSVGYKVDTIPFIPIASFPGDNVVKKSDKMPWYTGGTLLETINTLKEPEKPTTLPLRVPIQDVYNITGIGVVPVGRVETGILKVNDKVVAVPGRENKPVHGEVKTIEMHHEQMQSAEPGDNVGLSIRGFGKKDIARGDVMGHESDVPSVAKEFIARIVVLNHPSVVTVGYTPVFHIHTAQVACQLVEIQKQLNPATGEVVKEHPDFIKNGDAAIVKFRPVQPLVIEPQAKIPQMSRFAIRDSGATVAAGMCMEVIK
jgi:elongation factor 1-alpha